MFDSMVTLLGTAVVVWLLGGVALVLLALAVVLLACFLGLGSEVCRSIRGWLLHGHR